MEDIHCFIELMDIRNADFDSRRCFRASWMAYVDCSEIEDCKIFKSLFSQECNAVRAESRWKYAASRKDMTAFSKSDSLMHLCVCERERE